MIKLSLHKIASVMLKIAEIGQSLYHIGTRWRELLSDCQCLQTVVLRAIQIAALPGHVSKAIERLCNTQACGNNFFR